MGRKLTPEEHAKNARIRENFKRYYQAAVDSGTLQKEIAAAMGIDYTQLSRIVNDHDVVGEQILRRGAAVLGYDIRDVDPELADEYEALMQSGVIKPTSSIALLRWKLDDVRRFIEGSSVGREVQLSYLSLPKSGSQRYFALKVSDSEMEKYPDGSPDAINWLLPKGYYAVCIPSIPSSRSSKDPVLAVSGNGEMMFRFLANSRLVSASGDQPPLDDFELLATVKYAVPKL